MHQEHVMSLLRATQQFLIDSEGYLEKRLKSLPISTETRQTFIEELKAGRTVPKITPLPELKEHEQSILIKHISKEAAAFKITLDLIDRSLSLNLATQENIIEECADKFQKTPLYLKPVYCFKSAYIITLGFYRRNKLFDALKSISLINNNLDFVNNELQILQLDTKDYAHFSLKVNAHIRVINRESYINLTGLNKKLNIQHEAKKVREEFSTADYIFLAEDNNNNDKVITMLEYYVEISKNMFENLEGIEDKLEKLEVLHVETMTENQTRHDKRSLLGRIFYTFTYLETRRRTHNDVMELRSALNLNRLNRNRLQYLLRILSMTLVEFRGNIHQDSAQEIS